MSRLPSATEASLTPSRRDQRSHGDPQDDLRIHRHAAKRAVRRWCTKATQWAGRYAMVVTVLAIAVCCFTALRICMLVGFVEWRELSAGQLLDLFLAGLQFDVLVALCFALPQVIHITFVPEGRLLNPASRLLLEAEWLLGFAFLPFICIAEYIFFDEFQTRLNYIAFEYLVYPTEVCCNIWQSYPVINLLAAVCVVGEVLWFVLRRPFLRQIRLPIPWKRRLGFLAVHLSGMAMLWTTTSIDHCQVSSNRVVNECAGNGLYSFFYYAWTCRLNFDHNYITLDESDAVQRIRRQVVRENARLLDGSSNPVDRIIDTGRPRRDWNVVLILEESLGSDFIGVLGDNRNLTPHFDELVQEGILFDRFYATGNRTARALEAVLTSMPPLPMEAILKRDHSQRVYTLADILRARGYERLFMTAGRGLFDGVRSFMTSNGFNRFVEQSDFQDPVFCNAWGVSDEDLFRRALGEFDRLQETGRPFFATVVTVSNHRPYTFPEGRISDSAPCRENAVRYADWALGYYFREARQRAFFKNTLFVVLGDHGARVYGRQLFPMKSYRVPVLLIRPRDEGRGSRCSTLACSLDIPATIMGQLGGTYRSVFFGADALRIPPDAGRALMQHNHDAAILDSRNRLAVLGFRKSAWGFQLDPATFELQQIERPDSELLQNAAALFQSAFRLYYSDRWYPDTSVEPILSR